MYRAVELAPADKDLHRFVWRSKPNDPSSTGLPNDKNNVWCLCILLCRQHVGKAKFPRLRTEYPQATQAVKNSFYVDDGLTGADSVDQAIQLQGELQESFMKGGFLLRKWDPTVLENVTPEFKDAQPSQMMPSSEQYTKTLGIEWNASKDHFRLTISQLETITKRGLVSDMAKPLMSSDGPPLLQSR